MRTETKVNEMWRGRARGKRMKWRKIQERKILMKEGNESTEKEINEVREETKVSGM